MKMCISSVIEKFGSISLPEMDSVKLMNRTDRKYWFHRDLLPDILGSVAQEYYILEMDGERSQPYSTTYYDTVRDEMYVNHHRGKMNRYKIRRRNYISTNSSFLEIKFKSNKGRTIKIRRSSKYNSESFGSEDTKFIERATPYRANDLREVLKVGFQRLMLVGHEMNERCTIDCNIKFASDCGGVQLDDLVVVEVKTEGRSKSAIIETLHCMRIKPSSFSKYCIGRTMSDNTLAHNNFKQKHREIGRIITNLKKYNV